MLYSKSGYISLIIVTISLFVALFSAAFTSSKVSGVEMFSKNEYPFGVSYDDWISQFWNWWISVPRGEDVPPPDGCLINRSGSMVMLMENADTTSAINMCDISSSEGILVPLWVGWADSATPHDPNKTMSEVAREEANLGNVKGNVILDGIPIARLDVSSSLKSGELDYRITSLTNVSELYTSDFDLAIPEDTHKPNQIPGNWLAGSHGWWVFLKPLEAGEHTLRYSIQVTPTDVLAVDPFFHNSDVTYHLNVE
jgi:hypothetical protein